MTRWARRTTPSIGRMGGMLGLELLNTSNLTQNIILYGYASPPVDIMQRFR